VELTVGSLNKEPLKDGDFLVYIKTKGLNEMAEEIAEKVKPVLIEVKEIISYVNNPEGELKKTIKNLEVLTRNLERTRGGAENLLTGANRNLEEVTRKTTALLDTTSSKVESLDLDNLNATLERLPPCWIRPMSPWPTSPTSPKRQKNCQASSSRCYQAFCQEAKS